MRADEVLVLDHSNMNLLRQPLFRLLAVNLAIGEFAAVLLVGGLLAINLGRIRDLILQDDSPVLALGVLLSGLLITFGSAAMGAGIMLLGQDDRAAHNPPVGPSLRNGSLSEPPAAAVKPSFETAFSRYKANRTVG